jgi:DNA-binding MarR family transcriptional regulator
MLRPERLHPLLLRAAHRVRQRHAEVCEEHGLTFQQFNVLRILRGAEDGGEGALPTMEVADRMIEPVPGITRFMAQLEEKGWVQRTQCPDDGRRLLCRITEDGRAALARLDDPIERLAAELDASLSEDERETVMRFLTRLNELAAS